MNKQPIRFLNVVIAVAAIGGLSLCMTAPVSADPYTTNFVALITEMQGISASLSNSVIKTEIKQKATVDKDLALLLNKVSTTELTDLKNAVTVAKSLIKTFPGDFTIPQDRH